MALLDALITAETDRLWWQLTKAEGQVITEIALLERCSEQARTMVYGAGILDSFRGLLADLQEILSTDLQTAG